MDLFPRVLLITLIPWTLRIGCLCIYRLFLHPFANIPGPFWAKITNAYSAYHAARQDTHVVILRLHEKHGPVIRYGPNRLLFNTRESMEEIYGHHRNLFKGRAYDAMRISPVPSVFNAADNQLHSQRRKAISVGFSDSALRSCEPKIIKHVTRYCDVLYGSQTTGDDTWTEARNLTTWSAFFAVDLIADLAVGQSPNMLQSPKNRVYNPARVASFRRMGLAIQWPEAFMSSTFQSLKLGEVLFPKVAQLGREWHALLNSWIKARIRDLRAQEQKGAEDMDMIVPIMRYRDPESGDGLSDADLTAELTTLLIAGSGTITTGVTSIVWYITRDTAVYDRAVGEVRAAFDSRESIRLGGQLNSCVFLKACLQEAMRVSPAPTTPLYREAGRGGAMVCGIHIPEGAEVAMTIYALHHNEAYHPDSFEFRPERWLDKDMAATTKSAWAPFSHGPRNCVGMTLAMSEVLLAVSTLLWCGDFRISDDPVLAARGAGAESLGPGRTRRHEFQMYDTFGASTEGPYLQFKRRSEY